MPCIMVVTLVLIELDRPLSAYIWKKRTNSRRDEPRRILMRTKRGLFVPFPQAFLSAKTERIPTCISLPYISRVRFLASCIMRQ